MTFGVGAVPLVPLFALDRVKQVRVGLAHVHAVTARMLDRSGITGKPGAVATFPDLGSAVSWARQVSPGDVTSPGGREKP